MRLHYAVATVLRRTAMMLAAAGAGESEPVITGGTVYSNYQHGILGCDPERGRQAFEFAGEFPAGQMGGAEQADSVEAQGEPAVTDGGD